MADRRFDDVIHGIIRVDPLCLRFVDTEPFQRLRDLKQLGLTYLVYPGAMHSRFEHSLGVYCLAGKAIHNINSYQGSELGIDRFDIQTVKLAGLLHAVGHGPFGLTEFFPPDWSHEEMSLKMIDYIVDEHNIEIDSDVLKKVKDMITASSDDTSSNQTLREKRFLYDIVANGRNGIDVDKFDYIVRDSRACGLTCSFQFDRPLDSMRVIGDEICYHATLLSPDRTMPKLFTSHADLHRTVYTHAKVKAIELMFVDALTKANNHLNISSCIDDPAEYWKLDDSIMKYIETAKSDELKESRDLILRIRRRDLYQLCNEFTVPKDQLEYFKDVTPQDIICSQKAGGVTLKEEDIVVRNIKIDVTRGSKNPLVNINFFKDYKCEKKSPGIGDFGLSEYCCQEKIVRVYSKKPELVEVVSDAFQNFQLMNCGIKTQVHGTPQKKRERQFEASHSAVPLKEYDEDYRREFLANVVLPVEVDPYLAETEESEEELPVPEEFEEFEEFVEDSGAYEDEDEDDEENPNPEKYYSSDSSEESSSEEY